MIQRITQGQMKKKGVALTLFMPLMVMLCMALSSPAMGAEANEVPVTIDVGTSAPAENVVVTSGIPFAKGQVPDVSVLRLVDLNNVPVPAQFSRLVAWPDNSVKVALLSFMPAVAADGSSYKGYKVLYNGTESIQNPAPWHPVTVSETSSQIVIDTGVARFNLNKDHFTVFDQVAINSKLDGSYLNQLEAPGDLVFLDNNTGNIFRASNFTAANGYRIAVVDQGPLKTTVVATGKARAVSGANAFGEQDLLTYKVWMTFYANSGAVDIKYTWVDDTARPGPVIDAAGGSWPAPPNAQTVKYINLKSNYLELPLTSQPSTYSVGGDGATVLSGAVSGEKYIYQDATRTEWPNPVYDFRYSGVGDGVKAAGWMDISRGNDGVTIGIHNFWQNYPNKLAINDQGQLRAYLQPDESPTAMFSIAPGVGKTHDIYLNFHRGTDSADAAKKAQLSNEVPVIRADASWYAQSEVFGPLSAPDTFSAKWDSETERLFTCVSTRSNCSVYPVLYGKRDYGDYMGGYTTLADGSKLPVYYNQHYEDAHGWLVEYLRLGKKKYFNFAVPYAVHHYDLDVMHTAWPDVYPGYPAGMIHFHGSGEHEAAKMEPGHIVPGGIDEYFLLTGDPRALEVSKEQGDWVAKYLEDGNGRIAIEKPGDTIQAIEYERAQAWAQYTIIKTFESTNDKKYWDAATIATKNTIDWWKMPGQAITVFDTTVPIDLAKTPAEQALYYEPLDWTKGNGYFISTMKSANTAATSVPETLPKYWPYQDHVPISWMSAYLETTLIRYLENLKKMGPSYTGTMNYRGEQTTITVDTKTIKDMISQTVKVLADHNFESTAYPSLFPWVATLNNNIWVYSASVERVKSLPNSTDGDYQIPFALVYAANFSESEVSPALQPQWAATQAKLRAIAKLTYDKFVTNYSLPGGYTGYNSAPVIWNMPFALSYMNGTAPTTAAFASTDTQAPTVSVSAPAATVAGTATVTATVSDDTAVTTVEFYVNGNLAYSVNAAPFSFSWDTTREANGSYVLSAKAYDAAGNVGQSSPVTVAVANDVTAPTVAIAMSDSTVSGVASINVNSSDDVAVTKIEYYINGVLQGNSTSPAYSFNWNTASFANGSYLVTAKAYDAAGNVGSAVLGVTVFNDTIAPTITILTVPATSNSLTVPITVAAKDNTAVTGYFISENSSAPSSSAAGWVSAAPASFTFAGTGLRTLNVWAKDGAGNLSASRQASVSIGDVDTKAPAVKIVSPAASARVAGVVTVSASATDDVAVTKVRLYIDNSLRLETSNSSFSYNWNANGFVAGPHVVKVIAYDAANNAGTESITVYNDLVAPVVAITAPAANGSVSGTATVSVSASDNVGVTRVELLVNGVSNATATSAPYTLTWNTTGSANGIYTLVAKAYDASGNVGQSAAVSVNVNNDSIAPVISITTPVANATAGGAVNVSATASDNIAVTKVQFLVNGIVQATQSAGPYGFNWNTLAVANGTYTITAKAYDAVGNIGESSVTVAVFNDTTAPTVVMVQPVANGSGPVELSANATDNVGVTRVEFYVNDLLQSTSASAPYSFSWNASSLPSGTYSVYAKAYDAAGNVGQSATVQVTIDHEAPVALLTSPAPNSVVSGEVQINATASDNIAVTKVEFYLDGVLFSTAASAPYIMTWNTKADANGTYTVSAKAYDAAGNVSQAALLALQVDNDQVSPVLAVAPLSGKTTSDTRSITGEVSDNVAVAKVVAQVGSDNTPIEAVIEGNTWTCTLTNLVVGINNVEVTATDTSGNTSTISFNLKRH